MARIEVVVYIFLTILCQKVVYVELQPALPSASRSQKCTFRSEETLGFHLTKIIVFLERVYKCSSIHHGLLL